MINYSGNVRKFLKSGEEIVGGFTPRLANITHCTLGLACEFLEFQEAAERLHFIANSFGKHSKASEVEVYAKAHIHVVEELGDFLFFLDNLVDNIDGSSVYDLLKEVLSRKPYEELVNLSIGQIQNIFESALSSLKAHCFYGKNLGEAVKYQLLDVYISMVKSVAPDDVDSHFFESMLAAVASQNSLKLSRRYNKGSFSNQQAIERADKA